MKQILIPLGVIALIVAGFFVFQSSPNHNNEEQNTIIMENQPTENGEELQIEVVRQGTGTEAAAGNQVVVHYTGQLQDGTVFDSSVDRAPFSFVLGRGTVIEGWERGLLGMRAGEVRTLTIPPHLAYGENGIPGAIPSNATLVFQVELLDVLP